MQLQSILDYIMNNYKLIIFAIIIVLLAIIGYYADKTNFGQAKSKEIKQDNSDIKDKMSELNKKRLNDYVENKNTTKKEETKKTSELNDNNLVNAILDESETKNNKNLIELEKSKEDFDNQFDRIIPKKNIISTDLLNDIDSLSLDKTQKIELSDIPDLDDIDLPKIRRLNKEDEDIWKL